MPADVLKLVESVLAEKTAVATKERELISNLNRVLPGMGYRVVPIATQMQKAVGGPAPVRLLRPEVKSLTCSQCARTFAHPLHLGRHMSATHGAKMNGSHAGKKRAGRKMREGKKRS